ncbi:MAG: ATP-binding cassette domain-containing protein [Polaromonas sp.]|nr:ATP-binding cassette domain-containing protein [Polaromonas sp.]
MTTHSVIDEPGTPDTAHAAAAPPAATRGIAIVGVSKFFGMTKALNGCNFSALLGEIHAIVGGNGSGKSTLAKVISGVVPFDAGQVSVLGRSPAAPHEARAAGVATVFQEVLVADDCSVVENLYIGADRLWSRSIGATEKYETAKTLMRELTGTPIDPETLVGLLPLGTKQWITIGRALLCKPRVLILDESSAALDLDSTERLFAKMRELRNAGAAVIIVTHRIAELIRICDRATVLRDGKDVGVLEKSEITEKNLLRLMTGRTEAAGGASAGAAAAWRGEVVLKTRETKIWPGSAAVNWQLHQGEILGVAGLDGQGQSEFVRILAGVDPAVNSVPQVRNAAGQFVQIHGLKDAVQHGISYVSGDRKREGIFANLSIFENLLMPLYRRKSRAGRLAIINWGGLDGIFDWEVERLSIRMGERSNKITSLSGGNQQKVLIGRAFALNPNILVLNDPARGIDVGAKAELYKHLRDFASLGKSVVYLSSEIEEFVGFCSRVIVFRNGSIFDQFSGQEIHPTLILEAMFGQIRPGHHQSSEALDESKEINIMKIVDYDADGKQHRDGGRDAWKVTTSAYPNFDSHPKSPDVTPTGTTTRESGAARSDVTVRPRIVDFDRGDEDPLNSASKATERMPSRLQQSAADLPARSIKIVEFDQVGIQPRPADRRSGDQPIKIIDFDALRSQQRK